MIPNGIESGPPSEDNSYFAYGTLLGQRAVREYCATAEAFAVARYAAHQLEFRQYSDDAQRCGCNLARTPGRDMFGVVYKVSSAELEELDEITGVSRGWFERVPISVESVSGEVLLTSTYVQCRPGSVKVPASDYLALVRTGAREAGLPEPYVTELEGFLDRLEG